MKSLVLFHGGCGLAVCITLVSLTTLADALPSTDHPPERPEPIPMAQLGKVAGRQVRGDGLSLTANDDGARLRCQLQRLEGQATAEGLWLTSTTGDDHHDRFRLKAVAVGRSGTQGNATSGRRPSYRLASTGQVGVTDEVARFVRPGLVEEYSVNGDGVRQDFVVEERPRGTGNLRVELNLSGARAEPASYGARLVLKPSGRKMAYGKLHVTDADGRVLPARMEVQSLGPAGPASAASRLAVVVDDAGAVYPVRIDPTFTDEDWFSMGAFGGANNLVRAAVMDGSGHLIIGGDFTAVGTVPANRIARWDGSSWSALGSGLGSSFSDRVDAMAVSGSYVYAGGSFTNAGSVAVSRIARWDGAAWSALGSGVGGGDYAAVSALATSGSELYVGGSFTNAGGVAVNHIAMWDGSNWSALGSGVGGVASPGSASVHALAVSGGDLYAGGYFRTAGEVAADFVAKWDGSNWSALGHGVYGSVYALAVSGTDLYAGGSFKRAGAIWPFRVAKWDGGSWSTLGTGIGSTSDVWSVSALAISGSDLYAGGHFGSAGGVPASNMARWDGSNWAPLNSGVNGYAVNALAAADSNVYAGGSFTMAGSGRAENIARWDGSTWSAMAPATGLSGYAVYDVEVSGGDLYAGGSFTAAGGLVVNNVARWDGNTWSALGSGIGDDLSLVYALEASGGSLYAGGSFTEAGGHPANHIARWDGGTWSALGSGVNSDIYDLTAADGDLYAGGLFTAAGGNPANYIARWDGGAWSALGSGVSGGGYPYVYALEAADGNLYAGGSFTNAGGTPASSIARWNGVTWSALGSGVSGGSATVAALKASGGELYAGGIFTHAGGTPANNIAVWNGSTWSALGSGVGGGAYALVYALEMYGSDLYVGGSFTEAGGSPADNIACWDGRSWTALGSGTEGSVVLLSVLGTNLYAGGDFTVAGGKVSTLLAGVNLGELPLAFARGSLSVSNGFFRARLTGPEGASAILERSVTYEDWTPIATNPVPPGGWPVSVPAGPGEWQVYRGRREE